MSIIIQRPWTRQPPSLTDARGAVFTFNPAAPRQLRPTTNGVGLGGVWGETDGFYAVTGPLASVNNRKKFVVNGCVSLSTGGGIIIYHANAYGWYVYVRRGTEPTVDIEVGAYFLGAARATLNINTPLANGGRPFGFSVYVDAETGTGGAVTGWVGGAYGATTLSNTLDGTEASGQVYIRNFGGGHKPYFVAYGEPGKFEHSRDVSLNPWKLFSPPPRRIWVPSAGGAATHTTTGALASGSATVAGTAAHKTLHATSGALAAQASTIDGTAAHQHASTGALASQSATVAGAAAHKTLHATSGALTAQAGTIAGTADHAVPGGTHPTDGALASQAATLAGTAAHATLHATTGALAAQAASIAGTAGHAVVHETSGALAADSATISGAAAGPQPNIVQGRPRLPRRTTAAFWRQDDDDTLEARAIVLPIDLLGRVAMADDDDRLEAAASPVVYRYADGLRRHTPRSQDWITGRLQ